MILSKLTMPILDLPRIVKRSIVLLADVSLCVLSVYISFYLRLGEWLPIFSNNAWNSFLVLQTSVFFSLPIFLGFGLYREIFRYSGWFALLTLLRSMSLYAFIFILIFTVIGIEGVPRTVGLIQPMILLMLVGFSRALASYLLSNAYRKQLKLASVPRVLIYGAGHAGRQLQAALSHSYEMQVVGFLDDDQRLHGSILEGKRIYSPHRLQEVVASLEVSLVLLALPSASRFRRNQIIKLVRNAKLGIQTLPSMSDLAHGKVSTQDLRDLDVDDLLGRELVLPESNLLIQNTYRKKILVTGAGGSIGSELCRQILAQSPNILILVEQNEYALYQIYHELLTRIINLGESGIEIIPLLASVTCSERMRLILNEWRPDVIYHTAAYKHVPLVESNPVEGVRNNVFGTLTVAQIAIDIGIHNFILISTDKAVRPTNVMGASKRLAEMILQALAKVSVGTKFSMVRFGNVLNSSGSVVPKFRQQIKDGGPVTITDMRITRYFMTIPEAAQLVIQAGALARGGDVFLLDMGEPIRIVDLARRMIELSGMDVRDMQNPDGDIEITEIGLRPGEKLYEELLIDGSPEKTHHPRIFKSDENFLPWDQLGHKLKEVEIAINRNDEKTLLSLLQQLVSGYRPNQDGTEADFR